MNTVNQVKINYHKVYTNVKSSDKFIIKTL